ncbi:tRNA 5-hydroxyuridine modification protein YegQ [Thiohalobacter sp. IOR34]|uniref:prephenate-dependent tRNA uridine(34) hydroxylase TrhP n=1 Tax=Thiohalobacter sp. IOR34 TaxID=3057176 RepID=UPI0025AF1944|nr:tRNA 5-hydroxyuridine modification protein YegQ [Thiohalobacter sp. IOR34]WJW74828.1 tRNA 5-hydroxyuridine modification protein YegQ [Thiohalobacter sp. IOR34]
MKTPELLAPAGTLRNLRYALAYGADAVYAGMPRYSLRVRNNDFSTLERLAEGIALTHAQGKRFFLTSNLLPHNAKLKTFLTDLEPVLELGPDALIMADPGLIMLVRERWPELPVHLSVQANTMNHAAVRFWERLGIRRIILSRELSLDEVEEIRNQCPEVELEVFVHGALCIAYSGRCLLSGYFNHRDANQGSCTNACRWSYQVHEARPDESGDLQPATRISLLEEAERPGELMPVEEDEHGTYIMNSRDLRAVEHVERLVRIGVDSLKIEGRTKSHYYVARTTQVYRRAIDDALAGRPFDPRLLGSLDNLANRGYTDGFFQRHHHQAYQNYLASRSESVRQRFVGELSGYDADSGLAQVEVKNKFATGDELELILPGGNRRFRLQTLLDRQGRPLAEAPGGGHQVCIPLPPGDYAMGLLARTLP